MPRTRDIVKIIEAVVTGMEFPVQFNEVSVAGDLHTLLVDDLYHAQKDYDITIDGNIYHIQSVDYDTKLMVVKGDEDIEVTEFELYKPFFFHGTPMVLNQELVKIRLAEDKTPMVYLLEMVSETYIKDSESPIERESDLRLFFLTKNNHAQYLSDELNHECVQPMKALAESFVEAVTLDTANFLTEGEDYVLRQNTRFARYIEKGAEKPLVNDQLGGNELEWSIKIKKDLSCD